MPDNSINGAKLTPGNTIESPRYRKWISSRTIVARSYIGYESIIRCRDPATVTQHMLC